MRAADTNVVVRLLVRDDPDQVRAAQAFVAGGTWVSHVVLVEAAWVLATTYGLGPAAIGDGIEMLLNDRDFVVQDPGTVAAALRMFRARPKLGLVDCLILEIARKAGHLPLGTFDRELARGDGAERV
ncbi:MAG TPA: type II toxin-antitoxin system VapC family toxin [Polyangia bacterium]|nr:type II toxin-antitoxin system VapC family toxin [Polyangia bacterium]